MEHIDGVAILAPKDLSKFNRKQRAVTEMRCYYLKIFLGSPPVTVGSITSVSSLFSYLSYSLYFHWDAHYRMASNLVVISPTESWEELHIICLPLLIGSKLMHILGYLCV